jgi:hypothetical protein
MVLPTSTIEQIEQIRHGIDYRFVIQVRAFQMLARPLSMSETVEVANTVSATLQKIPEIARNRLVENTVLAKQTLITASTSDVGANDPKVTELILDRMTPEEIQAIFKQYLAGCDRCNPSLEKMSKDDLLALVDDIKKNAPTPEALDLVLTRLSHLHLLNLTSFLLTLGD